MDGLGEKTRKITYQHVGDELTSVIEAGEEYASFFKSKDGDAFTKLYNRLYPSVFYFARRFVLPEEAADITADAFYKLWKHGKSFNSLASIKGFLQITVRNACLNYIRDEKRKSRQTISFIQCLDANEEISYEDEEIRIKYLELIHLEIEKLPFQCRKVFQLAYFEGMRNKEIAKQLKLTEKTISSHKVHAIKVLRLAVLQIIPIILIHLLFSSVMIFL